MLKWDGLVIQMRNNSWRSLTGDTQDIVRLFFIWAHKEVIVRISKDRGQGLVWRTAVLNKVS
jgi:hypothetical protein